MPTSSAAFNHRRFCMRCEPVNVNTTSAARVRALHLVRAQTHNRTAGAQVLIMRALLSLPQRNLRGERGGLGLGQASGWVDGCSFWLSSLSGDEHAASQPASPASRG
ncbi:U1 small nuclear ribonucleoprotein 70 kda [Plakobranchus ocellatus]|uniref:U1 small nuclear ribonucleoprotein 70 kDa n=1 Tax=Plakobranchus ocellatus TaxID=259542 RepID=A0AAV3YVQ9_9GAST|nr:U1 small nuclear ribonucleoprotein 70 kda [Plakobranchus ocellatus]